jgi:hypothetical protein
VNKLWWITVIVSLLVIFAVAALAHDKGQHFAQHHESYSAPHIKPVTPCAFAPIGQAHPV